MRGELETEQNCNILTPSLLGIAAFPSRSPGLLNRGPGGIPTSSLQLIWTSCRWGYIIIWRPPTSCERHNSHSIQLVDSQGYPLIPDIYDRMHLLFTQVHFLFWQLDRGQYVTLCSLNLTVVTNMARWWAFVVWMWLSASQRISLFWREAHTKSLRTRFPTRPEEDEERQGPRAEQKGVSDSQGKVTVRERQLLKEEFLVAVWEFRSR